MIKIDRIDRRVLDNVCNECGAQAEFGIGLIVSDDIVSYLCKPCMDKRNAAIKKMQEETERNCVRAKMKRDEEKMKAKLGQLKTC